MDIIGTLVGGYIGERWRKLQHSGSCLKMMVDRGPGGSLGVPGGPERGV